MLMKWPQIRIFMPKMLNGSTPFSKLFTKKASGVLWARIYLFSAGPPRRALVSQMRERSQIINAFVTFIFWPNLVCQHLNKERCCSNKAFIAVCDLGWQILRPQNGESPNILTTPSKISALSHRRRTNPRRLFITTFAFIRHKPLNGTFYTKLSNEIYEPVAPDAFFSTCVNIPRVWSAPKTNTTCVCSKEMVHCSIHSTLSICSFIYFDLMASIRRPMIFMALVHLHAESPFMHARRH